MTSWQPLSVRRGLREPVGPHEGVPPALQTPLLYWLEGVYGYRGNRHGGRSGGMAEPQMFNIASRTGIALQPDRGTPGHVMPQILAACKADADTFLDVVDATLAVIGGGRSLMEVLDAGNSVWTVAADGKGLERRVEETAMAAFAGATAATDSASAELKEAWGKVYGRTPDPSDAWDHAIKAVEHVLVPIVTPNNGQATLGSVLGQLKAQPAQRTVVLASSSTTIDSVATLEAMLRLIWPNPDRHGGPTGASRVPSLQEAEGVVQLAVLVVQWVRGGLIS